MGVAVVIWLIAIPLLGLATGLRSMTPIAIVCWFAYHGDLSVEDSWAAWSGHLVSPIIFTVLALGELIVDKLPKTPNRTDPGPLAVRLLAGGLVGALAATGLQGAVLEGILLGIIGVLVGAFGGYQVRRELVYRYEWKDWHFALMEDAIAVVGSIIAMGFVTA